MKQAEGSEAEKGPENGYESTISAQRARLARILAEAGSVTGEYPPSCLGTEPRERSGTFRKLAKRM